MFTTINETWGEGRYRMSIRPSHVVDSTNKIKYTFSLLDFMCAEKQVHARIQVNNIHPITPTGLFSQVTVGLLLLFSMVSGLLSIAIVLDKFW